VFTQRQLEEGFFLQTLKDMWIAYDVDFGEIEQKYHIKQFGEGGYEKQVKEKAFVIGEGRDRVLAEYLGAQPECESHQIFIHQGHHNEKVYHLIHPKSFFYTKPGGTEGKFTIPLAENSHHKYSTQEDGFSSRHTLTNLQQQPSPSKLPDEGVRFEVKLHASHAPPPGGSPGALKKRILLNRQSGATDSALGKVALMSQ
jgi:hypothetical protein